MSIEHLFSYYKVRATLTAGMLGTVPKNDDVYSNFIAKKMEAGEYSEESIAAQTAEEVSTVPQSTDEKIAKMEKQGWTGFHTDPEKGIFIYAYMIRGFFKEAIASLRLHPKAHCHKLKAYKKKMAGAMFMVERRIYPIIENYTPGDVLEYLERPIRVETAQGERVSLVKSDIMPAGSILEFTIKILAPEITEAMVREILDYGEYKALGQWRSAQYGTFSYEMTEVDMHGKPVPVKKKAATQAAA